MFNSYLIERLRKYDGCDVDMNIRQISVNYEEILTYRFNNFVCTISLCTIILKFVQIPYHSIKQGIRTRLNCFT